MAGANDPVTTRRARGQVDAYLSEVAARLRGPRRHRERILAELGEGIRQAIDDRAAEGMPEGEATAAAIAEFGTPEAVADAFGPEVATAYARRTIAAYIATGPLVGIWWLLLFQPHPWRGGLVTLLAAIPVIPLIAFAVVTAGTILATTGRLMRWLPEAGAGRAVAATIAVAVLALVGDLVMIILYARSGIRAQPWAVLAVGASLIRIASGVTTLRHATAIRHGVNHR